MTDKPSDIKEQLRILQELKKIDSSLVALTKAFEELKNLGWLENDKKPRMISVQAEGCSPVVEAFHNGMEYCDAWLDAETIASGLRVPMSFEDFIITIKH